MAERHLSSEPRIQHRYINRPRRTLSSKPKPHHSSDHTATLQLADYLDSSTSSNMANMMEKIGDKLHMGHGKKDEYTEAQPQPQPHPANPNYGIHAASGAQPTAGAAPTGYGVHAAPGVPASAVPTHEGGGTMEKMKNKVKGKKGPHGEDVSSSSSESDGEGGRRKKKIGVSSTPLDKRALI
ncbi:hypothetical protein L7F22_023525 [Adiantum nelumboides]|nr:hypothetical protein [Adiantum nelumboides]